jgi:hypothetical protein
MLDNHPLWDRRASGVQVTNLNDRTVELRILMSAKDGGKLWDLRCAVREQMLTWLQSQGRSHLPRHRLERLNAEGDGEAASAE